MEKGLRKRWDLAPQGRSQKWGWPGKKPSCTALGANREKKIEKMRKEGARKRLRRTEVLA